MISPSAGVAVGVGDGSAVGVSVGGAVGVLDGVAVDVAVGMLVGVGDGAQAEESADESASAAHSFVKSLRLRVGPLARSLILMESDMA